LTQYRFKEPVHVTGFLLPLQERAANLLGINRSAQNAN
jgi:hypothetical protein